ncbi:MAG: universal stress protein [Burkholderiaceae bacterium]|nr:universal stress protein [Burkholderiaceae bacterium]
MKILVAIDGSAPSLAALKFAIDLIGRQSEAGSIGLICVRDDTALRSASHVVGRKAVEDYLRELSEEDLVEARKLLATTDIPNETIHRTGRPDVEICAAARDQGYDMIVMGSKGRTGISDLLIGSIAQRVAAAATRPVVLVK